MITVDIANRQLGVELPDDEIQARLAAWTAPAPHYTTGALAKYAKVVVERQPWAPSPTSPGSRYWHRAACLASRGRRLSSHSPNARQDLRDLNRLFGDLAIYHGERLHLRRQEVRQRHDHVDQPFPGLPHVCHGRVRPRERVRVVDPEQFQIGVVDLAVDLQNSLPSIS